MKLPLHKEVYNTRGNQGLLSLYVWVGMEVAYTFVASPGLSKLSELERLNLR